MAAYEGKARATFVTGDGEVVEIVDFEGYDLSKQAACNFLAASLIQAARNTLDYEARQKSEGGP
jgi:hypothetical protein